jgi:putative ABC transport system substrate-binding protein
MRIASLPGILSFCFLTLAAGFCTDCRRTETQQTGSDGARVYRVGVASYAPEASADRLLEGLYAGLEGEGFIRGRNLDIEHKMAGGEMANIPLMLQGLDGQNLDLIITLTTPVLASACKAVRNSPVVFSMVTDPIAAGAGTTFSDHLPNVTGVGSLDPVDEGFEILFKLQPDLKAVGTLYNPSEANSVKVISLAREVARRRHLRLEEVTVNATNEVLMAAQSLTLKKIDALWVATDNTAAQAFAAIAMTATKARLPLVANANEQIQLGALIAVGPSWRQVGEVTARKAARVLRGENPKDIPFENFVGATVALNQTLAKQMGISFPPEVAALDGQSAPAPATLSNAPGQRAMWLQFRVTVRDEAPCRIGAEAGRPSRRSHPRARPSPPAGCRGKCANPGSL